MTKNRELVRHLADLVCLAVTDGEVTELERDLADIRSLVDRVHNMDLPSDDQSSVSEEAVTLDLLRPDQVDTGRTVQLENLTKHVRDGFLVVPPVLGEDT